MTIEVNIIGTGGAIEAHAKTHIGDGHLAELTPAGQRIVLEIATKIVGDFAQFLYARKNELNPSER